MAGDEELLGNNEEDQQRLSIGQLIANGGMMKQPSFMPKTATATGDAATVPAPDVRPPLDPNSLPEEVRGMFQTQPRPDQVPVPPSGRNNPNLARLAEEQARLSNPIDPMDPATHKIKPEYRMGTGAKILGSVGNFLSGFGGRKEVVDVSPGATNWRFGREEGQREKQLEGVNTQIKTQEQLDSENEKIYRDAIRQGYETQLGDARQKAGNAAEENAATRKALEASQAELNKARANRADQTPEPKNEVEVATALQTAKASGDKAALAKWQGVLDELARQKKAGRDTSASDVSKAIQVAEYRGKEHDRIDQSKEADRNKRYAELDKDMRLKYNPQAMAAAKAKIDTDLETKYSPKHQNVDDQADKMLGLTKSGKALQSAPKSAPRALPKIGDTISVAGKPHRVTGINPKTKKPIVEPISGQ